MDRGVRPPLVFRRGLLDRLGWTTRKHRSAGPIDGLEDLSDELLQERLHAFPVPARINVKLVALFPGHPDIHLHQIPLEERVLIPGAGARVLPTRDAIADRRGASSAVVSLGT